MERKNEHKSHTHTHKEREGKLKLKAAQKLKGRCGAGDASYNRWGGWCRVALFATSLPVCSSFPLPASPWLLWTWLTALYWPPPPPPPPAHTLTSVSPLRTSLACSPLHSCQWWAAKGERETNREGGEEDVTFHVWMTVRVSSWLFVLWMSER